MQPARYTGRDFLFALLTALLVLTLCAATLTMGIGGWGDDYAAYLYQGFALADGRLEEQFALNARMHPTPLPDEAKDGRLVYAWGLPLLEAAVYRSFGFDRENYDGFLPYKMITLFSMPLIAAASVLFFRRRFSLKVSVYITLLFCLNARLVKEINYLYSDLPFVGFTMLTLLAAECFAFSEKPLPRALTGLLYAVSMWCTYTLRLNGFTVILICAFGHIWCFVKKQIKLTKARALTDVLPYALFAAMAFVSQSLLPKVTSNMSDFSRFNFKSFIENLGIVIGRPYYFFDMTARVRIYVLGAVFYICALMGLRTRALRDNLYLTVLWLGTLAVLLLLPYQQGVRYLYNTMPIMLIFAVYGFKPFRQLLKRKGIVKDAPRWRRARKLALALLMAAVLVPYAIDGISDLSHGLKKDRKVDAYSAEALETYAYIRENVPEDALIAFLKPRGLYLITGRESFCPGYNGHEMFDADYLLFFKLNDFRYDITQETYIAEHYTAQFENECFALYDLDLIRPYETGGQDSDRS